MPPPPAARERLAVALDVPTLADAEALIAELAGAPGWLKVGSQLFTAAGPAAVVAARGAARVFLDLKFHDIPNTVAGAVRSAVRLRPFCLTLHAAGGRAMMRAAAEAAREAAEELAVARPRLLGVTVLTSFDEDDMVAVGMQPPLADQVNRLAELAETTGLDGVVCSAHEITELRQLFGDDFKLVVPGIRPAWSSADDQKRVLTPAEALRRGADYLVIGRPISRADDPPAAARRIVDEMAGAAG